MSVIGKAKRPKVVPTATQYPLSVKENLRVVVAGELGSGKSSVINSVVRKELLPKFFGQNWRPALLVRYGETEQLLYTTQSGQTHEVSDWSEIEDVSKVALCVIQSNQPHLRGYEFVEIPFFHDGRMLSDAVEFISSAHVLIWVTISSQAWRLTERQNLLKLEGATKPHRILAVSRADKLRTEEQRSLISQRLVKETGSFFSDIVFMHSNREKIRGSEFNAAAWDETKGARMFDILKSIRISLTGETPPEETKTEPECDDLTATLVSQQSAPICMQHWKSVRSNKLRT